MTEDELSRLEALCEAATEVPWEWGQRTDDGSTAPPTFTARDITVRPKGEHPHGSWIADCGRWHDSEGEANAALIVAAVNALPALIAEVRRLRGVQMPYEGFGDDARIMANYLTAVDKHDQIGIICRGAVERVLEAAAPPQDSAPD